MYRKQATSTQAAALLIQISVVICGVLHPFLIQGVESLILGHREIIFPITRHTCMK